MNRHLNSEELESFVRHYLADPELTDAEEHLAECPLCLAECERIQGQLRMGIFGKPSVYAPEPVAELLKPAQERITQWRTVARTFASSLAVCGMLVSSLGVASRVEQTMNGALMAVTLPVPPGAPAEAYQFSPASLTDDTGDQGQILTVSRQRKPAPTVLAKFTPPPIRYRKAPEPSIIAIQPPRVPVQMVAYHPVGFEMPALQPPKRQQHPMRKALGVLATPFRKLFSDERPQARSQRDSARQADSSDGLSL